MADGMSSVNMNGGRMRMFGLASGLDIDSMVQKLMKAESAPLDQMKQQKTIMEWRQDDYREMNKLLKDLDDMSFDMSLQSAFQVKTAASSNSDLVSVSADGSSNVKSFSINEVTQLATAAYNSSAGTIAKTGETIDANDSIMNQASKFTNGLTFTDHAVSGEKLDTSTASKFFTLKNGGIKTGSLSSVTVGTDTYNVYETEAAYDAAPVTENKVLLSPETGQLFFNNEIPKGADVSIDYTYQTVDFSMTTYDENGKEIPKSFSINANQSLNNIFDEVNASELGVHMFFDEASQKVSISRSETGDFNKAGDEIVFGPESFLTGTLGLTGQESGGTDAEFTVNGLTTSRHSNSFSIEGVNFDLHQTFTSTQAVSVSISDDVDTVAGKIKDWVDKYNEVIKKVNDKISEKRYRDYQPLTEAQQKDMSDNEIKLWTEKAKSGLLAQDNILPSGLSKLRMALYSPVASITNGDYDQLSEIGITTSADYKEHGKLEIDMDKLKAALADDPQSVRDMFTNNSDTFDNQGLMERVSDVLDGVKKNIEDKAGNSDSTYTQFSMGRSMHELDARIDDFQKHLDDIEDRYYRQFTAMEQAIQRSNQQSGFIMSNFS